MPLVRIDMPAGRSGAARQAIGDAVQRALHEALGVPIEERFQVLTEHGPGGLSIDPGYLGITRSAEAILVQVTLNQGRDAATKAGFYKSLADELHAAAGVRRADVVISLVEVKREDWSFGDGEAQLA